MAKPESIGKIFPYLFSAGLLLSGCLLRSKVLVDSTLLLRLLLLTVFVLVIWLTKFRDNKVFRFNFYNTFFFLFFLWNLASALWSIAPSEAAMQAQMVFLAFMIFITSSAAAKEYPSFGQVFGRMLIPVLLLSFGFAFYRISTLRFYDPYRIISVSANNNLYTGFLLLSLPFLFSGYSVEKGYLKYASLLTAVMALFFIIILQSRAAYLGAAVAAAAILFFLLFRFRALMTRHNLIAGLVSAVLLFSGVFIFYRSLDDARKSYFLSKLPVWNYFRSYEYESLRKMMKAEKDLMAGDTQVAPFDFAESYHENANLRVIFWKKSWGLIKEHPLCGVGAGNWRLAVPSVAEPPNPEHTRKNYTYSQPHNEWICMISELGLAGFIMGAFVLLFPVVISFRRILPRHGIPAVETLFYASFLAGFFVYACFDFPLKRVEHNVLLFTAIAFLTAKDTKNYSKRHKENLFLFKVLRVLRANLRVLRGNISYLLKLSCAGRAAKTIASFTFTLLLLFTIVVVSFRIRGEYYTLKMFRNEGKNDDRVIMYCHAAQSPFYRITPNTLPLDWFEGVAWYHKGDFTRARACFVTALKSTPCEVRVLNDYAAALYSSGEAAGAKQVLHRAVAVDPYFDDAWFNLAAINYFTGNPDSALQCVLHCRESRKKKDFLDELRARPYPQ